MKHIFVVNPHAGQKNHTEEIERELEEYKGKLDYMIYQTKARNDAKEFVYDYCLNHKDEETCFYACGGDGTLNEVLNGLVGFDNALLSVYACGSGNDFVKYYGGKENFLDVKKLINGREEKIDVIKIGELYSINVLNFGFDAYVAKTMIEVKKKPLIGGKRAYTTGIIKALFKAMKSKCTLVLDGKKLNDGTILLCTVSNAQFVGGGFRCAPRGRVDDGLLEVCIITPVSRLKFIKLIGSYKKGEHLEDPKFNDCRIYSRGKKVQVKAPDGFCICLDGEVIPNNDFTAEVMQKAVRFVVPQGATSIMDGIKEKDADYAKI